MITIFGSCKHLTSCNKTIQCVAFDNKIRKFLTDIFSSELYLDVKIGKVNELFLRPLNGY